MNGAFWRSKKVLITGHTGFKGSWLSLWLQSVGADIVGYALDPPTEPSLFDLARVADGMISLRGDVLNQHDLQIVIDKHRPEVVFHLAAQALVRQSYENPVVTYATNVMGVVHLLEAVRNVGGVRAVVCVTSDKCYQNREWIWGYRENEAMGGYDPYSSSKGCAELVTDSYRNSFFHGSDHSRHGVAVATARAGNVIGGGDWSKDRLLPDIIRSVMTGKDVVLRNPNAIRPWQHVLDPLHGYILLAEKLYEEGPAFSEGWNFAPAETYTVRRLVEELLSLWGNPISAKQDQARQPHEDSYMMLDSTKARLRLGWRPVLDLKTTLSWVVEWTKLFQNGADMRNTTQAQIDAYTTLTHYDEAADIWAKQALAASAGELADLLHDTVIVRDFEGRIYYWNRGAKEMYGWGSEEAVGHISHGLLQTKFPKPLEEIESQLASQGSWEGELVHTTRKGSRVVVKSRWVLKKDGLNGAGEVFEINQLCSGDPKSKPRSSGS